ncbi:MAG: ribosomal protein S18-alanine N-acetyltransferase [Zoogloea sp.]|nr:ribosomal protein S18-alanine N-acetyltransferase [Zoogloea sp.]
MSLSDLDWVAARDAELFPFPWSRTNFSDSLAAGYVCRMMYEGGERIGYAVMMMVLDEAHILDISVVQARQRAGCGARLLRHLCDLARENGAAWMFLEVRPSNAPALALYERSGFEQIGRRKGYYPAASGREDALVMRLSL